MLKNKTKNIVLAENVEFADNPILRTIGLLNRSSMLRSEALVIVPSFSIHTFFMKFDIDVAFVDINKKVVAIYKNIKPYRILPFHITSHYVIEMKTGCLNVEKGDMIEIVKN